MMYIGGIHATLMYVIYMRGGECRARMMGGHCSMGQTSFARVARPLLGRTSG